MTIKDLKPQLVWDIFYQITQVPRPSKKEDKIRAFILDFAQKHNLQYKVDDAGNVAIFRPAAPGYENVPAIVMQGHMDMVCEKIPESKHDFDNDPIETIIDGEWMKANGTTLGADNGIGLALAMAALIDPDLKVGPLQALCTVDEETGLTGASNMGPDMINGKYLLNLDSEEDGEICMGCAGGIGTTANFYYTPTPAPQGLAFFRLGVAKLQGGHSGTDINAGRACANKVMARFLWNLGQKLSFTLGSLTGGNLRNAIARDAEAVIGINAKDAHTLSIEFNEYIATVKNEYKHTEPDADFFIESVEAPATCIDSDTAKRLISALYVVPHGVISMSMELEGLVETSTNLSSVKNPEPGNIEVVTSQRSSVESRKLDAAYQVESVFALAGAKVEHSKAYQGWAPNKNSNILKIAEDLHQELFGVKANVTAIHAGLECGLFLANYPWLDMISFGPTLRGVHSPTEKMHIPAVARCWNLLSAIIRKVAENEK